MKKALLVLMCGLLLFGVAALADVHFGHESEEHGMDLRFGDGNELRFGGIASMFWETGDASANYLAVELPSISAVDVPVLAVGIGLDGVDLGFFDTQTQPAIVVVDLDRDSYVALTWAADDSPAITVGGGASSITIPNIAAYTWNDDIDLAFGTGSPGSIEWTTADDDANCLIIEMPAGDGTDVPGVGIVTTDADLGYFNGETAPFFFIEDDDGDSYIFLGWSADDKAEFVGGGSVSELDVDFDIIRNTTADFRIEFDADAYIKFAVSDTTGNVAITQTGSTKNVSWTTTGAVAFAFGSLGITGNTTQTGSITLCGAGGDLTVGDDLTVADDIILSDVISHEWNPDNIQTASSTSADVTAVGCAFGDLVIVGAPLDVEDLLVSATVTTSGTITIVLANNTAAAVDLQTGSWKVFWFDATP